MAVIAKRNQILLRKSYLYFSKLKYAFAYNTDKPAVRLNSTFNYKGT